MTSPVNAGVKAIYDAIYDINVNAFTGPVSGALYDRLEDGCKDYLRARGYSVTIPRKKADDDVLLSSYLGDHRLKVDSIRLIYDYAVADARYDDDRAYQAARDALIAHHNAAKKKVEP
jgi:hypothetical protein